MKVKNKLIYIAIVFLMFSYCNVWGIDKPQINLEVLHNEKILMKNVKIEEFFTQPLNVISQKGIFEPSGVQGGCANDNFFFFALLNNDDGNNYMKQETKIIKFDVVSQKIVAIKSIGKIGHSNTLTYNKNNRCIYAAPCTKFKPFIVELDENLNIMRNIPLKYEEKGKTKTLNSVGAFAYDERNQLYLTKTGNSKITTFNNNFSFKKTIECSSNLKLDTNYTGQGISCDGEYIIAVCNNLKVYPRLNYILFFDLNGKFLSKHTFGQELICNKGEKIEFEQVIVHKKDYYVLANVFLGKNRFFRIYKIIYNN